MKISLWKICPILILDSPMLLIRSIAKRWLSKIICESMFLSAVISLKYLDHFIIPWIGSPRSIKPKNWLVQGNGSSNPAFHCAWIPSYQWWYPESHSNLFWLDRFSMHVLPSTLPDAFLYFLRWLEGDNHHPVVSDKFRRDKMRLSNRKDSLKRVLETSALIYRTVNR